MRGQRKRSGRRPPLRRFLQPLFPPRPKAYSTQRWSGLRFQHPGKGIPLFLEDGATRWSERIDHRWVGASAVILGDCVFVERIGLSRRPDSDNTLFLPGAAITTPGVAAVVVTSRSGRAIGRFTRRTLKAIQSTIGHHRACDGVRLDAYPTPPWPVVGSSERRTRAERQHSAHVPNDDRSGEVAGARTSREVCHRGATASPCAVVAHQA